MQVIINLKYTRKEITREEHRLLYGRVCDEYVQDPALAKYYTQEKSVSIESALSLPEQIALTQLALTELITRYKQELIK